jgi:release factor glutamine methyltransferase
VSRHGDVALLTSRLSDAGFVAADDEADELVARAADDPELLEVLVARRLTGEPLAWITGGVSFCGVDILVHPGVYVPRWQSEPLARRALARLPSMGTAVDLCTGAGAVAKTLSMGRTEARVVASEIDERAVACASANGVEVYQGDLFVPLPAGIEGQVDVVVGIVPYVPTSALEQLPRDTLVFETHRPYDGGVDGTDVLRRVVADSTRYLRPGGALLLELGGDQVALLGQDLERFGFVEMVMLADDDGDTRGIEATWGGRH